MTASAQPADPDGALLNADPGDVIAAVLDTLRQSRALLLDPCPPNIDRCRLAVAQCVQRMARLMEEDRTGWNGHELRASLSLVRQEISGLAGLLDSAAAFRRNMLKVTYQASRPQRMEIDAQPQKAVRVHVLG